MEKVNSLYIHIPFCRTICGFCDFTKILYLNKFINPYINALINEIRHYNLHKLKTVYIGGGSPSALSCQEIKPLLEIIKPLLDDDNEFTIECNPEDIDVEKISLYHRYGVNRISLGVQSFDKKVLKAINRTHNYSSISKVISIIKENGINNISIDLIYGLPEQTFNILKEDINKLFTLPITHFSAYSLTINSGTLLYNQGVREIESDLSREYYDYILKEARSHGFTRYEVSNFAQNEKYSRHNLVYWNASHYVGVGLGSSGYIDNMRYQNTRNIEKYISDGPSRTEQKLSHYDEFYEFLMLKLRTMWGFSLKELSEKFNITQRFMEKINEFISKKLLIDNNGQIFCSDDGLMILDHILIELFKEIDE